MYEGREIYPEPPLALVAMEIRFPYTPQLGQETTRELLQSALFDILPIRRNEEPFVLQINGVPQTQGQAFRLIDKASTIALTLQPQALTVETTGYKQYPEFRDLIIKVVELVKSHAKIALIERIGLRYVDEIRVPTPIDDVRDWAKWVRPDLIAPTSLGGNTVTNFQSVTEYKTGEHTRMLVRAGALNGAGVVGNDPLKRRFSVEPGPFFVLDMDSFWQPDSMEHAIDFETSKIRDTLDFLHDPLGDLFQACLSDDLRAVFRGDV